MPNAALKLARQYGLIQPQRLAEGIARGDLARLLQEAAAEAERQVFANINVGTFSSLTRAKQLEAAQAGLGSLSASLWGQVGALTRAGIHDAAQLTVDQQLDLQYLTGMPMNAIRQYAEGMSFSAYQSAEDIISRRTNGFKLADRIYANGRFGVIKAAKEVERGLALQEDARTIAKRVHGLYNPDVPGGQSYAAMRLARTEINNAHHDTTIRLTKDQPWVEGYRWFLSGSHPKHDVCNDYAERDHSNMGPGIFAKADVPSKPHPHCLCYIAIQMPDREQFLNDLIDGKHDSWLNGQGVNC